MSKTRRVPQRARAIRRLAKLREIFGPDAAIARERVGVNDPEVLSAIEKHTTGAAEMSPLDAAVYLADSLEPDRKFPERADLWQLAMRDLEGAVRETLCATARHRQRKAAAAEARASAS